jgi:hypothetical protein
MPCDYSKYPGDWKSHRVPRILAREGNACKFCGARNGSIGYRGIEGDWWETARSEDRIARKLQTPRGCGLTRIVLTVAHLKRTTGDPAKDGPLDCPDEDLAALCQACHLSLDRERHIAKRKQSRLAKRAVGSLFQEASL